MSYREVGIAILGCGIGVALCPFLLLWAERVEAWFQAKRAAWHWRSIVKRATKRRDAASLQEGKRGSNTFGDDVPV